MDKVKVEMCLHYIWDKGPKCLKGHKAIIKCHSERPECPDYEPSYSYPDKVRKLPVQKQKGG